MKLKDFLSIMRSSNKPIAIIIRKLIANSLKPIYFLDLQLAFYRTKSNKRILMNDKILLYAHHAVSKIDEFDLEFLTFFKSQGYTLVIYSNCEINGVIECDFLIKKNKRGRDLFCIKRFFDEFEIVHKENVKLVFANNSMIWNVRKLFKEINDKSNAVNTIYFMTESTYPVNHVQPYLFFVDVSFDRLSNLNLAFNWIKPLFFKRSIVYFLEYKFSKRLVQNGWSVSVRYMISDFSKHNESQDFLINASHQGWFYLHKKGFPGIKKSLVLKNPLRVKNIPKDLYSAYKLLHD